MPRAMARRQFEFAAEHAVDHVARNERLVAGAE
jgi:hypothetical protein